MEAADRIECRAAQELLLRRGADALDDAQTLALSVHLAACPACRRGAEAMARTVSGLR